MAMPEHLKTGLRGEQLAARELRRRGYRLMSSGFRTSLGETDIVAMDRDGMLCFVEVKTRAPGGMFPPSDAVDREKQARLVNNAAAYLSAAKPEYTRVRFDIAEVILHDLTTAEINIIEDAFGQDAFPNPVGTKKRRSVFSLFRRKRD